MLLFTLLLAVAAGVIFGSIPLVHIFRTELSNVFRQESRTGTSGRGAVLLRNAMVTGQVAIAFVLLIGAGLLMVNFRSALQVEPGFQSEETLTLIAEDNLLPLMEVEVIDGVLYLGWRGLTQVPRQPTDRCVRVRTGHAGAVLTTALVRTLW